MRRAVLALISAAMALALAACGAPEGEKALAGIRDALAEGAEAAVTAEVSSTLGGRYAEYTLSCVSSGGEYTLEVLEPAELAGVSARCSGGEGELEFSGLVLSCPVPEGLTPLTALPALLEALEGAQAVLSWSEGDQTLVSLDMDDELGVTVAFGEDMLPVSAEFTLSGESAAVCEIKEFSISHGT